MYYIGEEELEALRRVVVENKQLFRCTATPGEVDKFEGEWAEKIGAKYALCVSGGGTAAIVCALAGLGIGPGDEVIVPAYTWLATATSVLTAGAIPVLADVDATLGLDPDDVERKITKHTKAIIPVHMLGRPADMERLTAVARAHDLKVIEDCCQMDGGSYKGKRVGTWGDAGAFSFNQFKIIGCGEGGALVTDSRRLYERALIYSDSGANFRSYAAGLQEPIYIGQQLRANEMMGAVLREQTKRLDTILGRLRRVKKMLADELADVPGLRFAPSNDPEGDCGVVAAFQFDTKADARLFAARLGAPAYQPFLGNRDMAQNANPGLAIDYALAYSPFDSDKHVYIHWTPLWERRIGHHPAVNPYNHPDNKGLGQDYSPGMCSKTLDYLSRTVYLPLFPDWDDASIAERAQMCRQAVR